MEVTPPARAFDYQASVRECVFKWTSALTARCKASGEANGGGEGAVYTACTSAGASAASTITQYCEQQANKEQQAAQNAEEAKVASGADCPVGTSDCSPSKTAAPAPAAKTNVTVASKTGTTTKPLSKVASTPTTKSPSSKGTTSSAPSTSDAEAEASADIAQCSGHESTASLCCGNPLSCSNQLSQQDQQSLAQLQSAVNSGAGTNSGMNGDCQQMEQMNNNSGQLNNALAAVCTGDQSSCSNTCSQLIEKYQRKLATCQGCANESVYQNAIDALSKSQGPCQALQARANQLATQGIASGSGSGSGSLCNQMASASPQSLGSQPIALAAVNANDPYGCQANPNQSACQSCADNPSGPGCDQAAPTTGQAGFAQGSVEPKPSDFDVGDPTAGIQPQTQIPVTETKVAQRVPRVQNDPGTGIPGDNSSGQTNVNQASGRKVVSMGSGYSTDVFHGYRSGGYSRSYASDGSSSFNSPTWQAKPKKSSSRSFSLISYLKNWMSGGLKPLRKIAVALGLTSPQQTQSHSRPEVLGQGSEIYLDPLPPPPGQGSNWISYILVSLIFMVGGLIFWKLWTDVKEEQNAYDRRQAERRHGDRRARTIPIEPHLERRKSDGKDRRIRDQRLAKRRQA